MSTPFTAAALRGAVDLSGLKKRATPASASAGPAPADSGSGVGVIAVTDATFQQAVATTTSVAAVLVLYSSAIKESVDFVEVVWSAANDTGGRLQVMAADIDTELAIRQAFQVQSVPVVVGLVKARPVPLFSGVYSREEVAGVFGQLVELAAQQGVTGTVSAPDLGEETVVEEPVSAHHEAAFAAIEAGDLDAARTAYQAALGEDPDDDDARLGLAQVALLQRTRGVELQQARDAAAADPQDIDAATLVADLDVLGGHIDDAFTRLIDLVRATSGADRDRVRTHLIGLFDVVGPADDRVRRARTALMSALF
ncbi:MAG: tetratricopeptide repeat protein [Dermatophilaceae bacterium]